MPNFNAFMHRRNIFRKEPDFKKLACDYHELKQYMTVNSKSKLKFDFKNPDALRALTCALLHRYFQKRITLPPDRLIPAVPQRLNYICWVEDLVKLVEHDQPDSNILGFDIGTGASCIFPILACHRNPSWSFIGVEADAKSHAIAVENVQKNFMEDRIRLVKITTEDTLNDIIALSSFPVTFIMCNPPFFEEEYGVTLEVCPNGASSRPKSSNNTSDKIESVISGGEIAFVGHMLEQSRHLKEEVTIYTSMLGKKQSLTHFKQTLFGLNDDNLTWTWAELCQGKTIRYAIAWSFKPGLDLTRAPPLRHGKNKSWKFKLTRKMQKRDCQLELMENSELLKNLVTRELLIAKNRVTKQTSQQFEMLIKTNDRTWTNQRRKRREQLNKHKHQATSSSMGFPSSGHKAPTTSPVSPQHQSSANDICFQTFETNSQMLCDSDSSNTKDNISPTRKDRRCIDSDVDKNDTSEYFDMNADLYSQEIIASLKNFENHRKINSTLETCGKAQSTSSMNFQQQCHQGLGQGNDVTISAMSIPHANTNLDTGTDMEIPGASSRKRKNPSSCSSSPSRICPSPNDEHTDDDNQSTDNTENNGNLNDQDDDSMNGLTDIKRICIKDTDDSENMDDIYDYLLCCRISLTRVCHDLYFELKLEHPCTAASDAYDLFLYFRNKLSEK